MRVLSRVIMLSLCAGLTAFSGVGTSVSSAQAMPGSYGQGGYTEVPLVVIRFNQQRVYYDKQLYNALNKAVAIKPTLSIDLVSYVPQGADRRTNDKFKSNATPQIARVIKSLTNMGVPRSRIRVTSERTGTIKFHEVHLYVE